MTTKEFIENLKKEGLDVEVGNPIKVTKNGKQVVNVPTDKIYQMDISMLDYENHDKETVNKAWDICIPYIATPLKER